MLEILTHLLNAYGLGALFALISVEYLGIPLPTELAYIAGERMASLGVVSPTTVFIVIMAGHLLGSQVAYELGRRSARLSKRNRMAGSIHRRLTRWYRKYGALTVFLTQLIGHVRPWASYVAGFSGIGRRQFLILSMAGSAVLTLIMLLLSDVLVRVWETYPILRTVIVGAFVIMILGMIISGARSLLQRRSSS